MPIRFLFLVLGFLPLPLSAHPLDLGFIQMASQDGKIGVTLDLNPSLAAQLLGVGPTELSHPLVQSRYRELFAKTLADAPLRAGGAACTLLSIGSELLPQTVRLSAVAECPRATQLEWSFPFIHGKEIPRTFQVLVKASFADTEHLYTADSGHDAVAISVTGTEHSFGRFVLMGIQHIGATPGEWLGPGGFHLPDGIDHILFLLGLILAGGSLLQMVKTATGFTVGHSVTLAIASLGILRLPSRLVESSIALSIAYVAVETLLMKEPRARWRIAAAFGLVHGFGFAAALTHLDLSGSGMAKALVGFNCGVEVGQVILVALMAPCIALLRKQQMLRAYAVPGAAGGIFLAGAYWFLQRAFGL